MSENVNSIYKFERMRLGKKDSVSTSGVITKYGPYLYRNIDTGILISSWEKPDKNKTQYSYYDIGMNADALIYYKNY